MLSLPSSVEPIFLKLSAAFTERTAPRVAVLMVGMILARGRHTITAALRGMGILARGHFTTDHRVFSRASWSPWQEGAQDRFARPSGRAEERRLEEHDGGLVRRRAASRAPADGHRRLVQPQTSGAHPMGLRGGPARHTPE